MGLKLAGRAARAEPGWARGLPAAATSARSPDFRVRISSGSVYIEERVHNKGGERE